MGSLFSTSAALTDAPPPLIRRRSTLPSGGQNQQNNKNSSDLAVQLALELVSATVYATVVGFTCMALYDWNNSRKSSSHAASKKLKRRFENKVQHLNEHEAALSADVVYPEEVDCGFDSVGGLNEIKQEIYDLVVLPLQRPELFNRGKLAGPPKGILLYGPPGTGKTMMAKALAKESGAAFLNLQMSTTMSKWFGESQKLVRATFTLAEKLSPCLVFIDEIDSFLRARGSDDQAAQSNMKAEFMSLWDGLLSKRNSSVIVVGATNRPWDVDPAILRRMPRTFELNLPDEPQRLDILSLALADYELENGGEWLVSVASKTRGFSGSDLTELARCACLFPIREAAREIFGSGDSVRSLRLNDFLRALEQVRPTGETAYEYQRESDTGGGGGGGSGSSEFFQGAVTMLRFLSQQQHQSQHQSHQPPESPHPSSSGVD